MSALDQAFVKAYRQGGSRDRAPAAHLPVAHFDARPTEPALVVAEVVDGAPSRDGRVSVDDLYASQVTFADIGHASVRRPHASFAAPFPRQAEIALPPLAQETPTPAPTRPPAASEPPLTAAFARGSTKAPDAPPNVAQAAPPLRAVFEVPRFSWPVVVKTLGSAAEAQLNILAKAMAAASRNGQKLVLVTGCIRGEGRTTVTLSLGKALASPARKVLLVDADFEHAQLADALGILPQVGWDDILWGNQPLAEALVESLDDHLSLLPLRQSITGLQRRTPTVQWKASLSELTKHYDMVLLDAGPLTDERKPCDTAALAAQHPIDAALVVRDLRRVGVEAARDVGQRLMACDITRWNLVENFCPAA